MKRIIIFLALAILAMCQSARADIPWNMQLQPSGLYWNVGIAGNNDGYTYERYKWWDDCHCYWEWRWRVVGPIYPVVSVRQADFYTNFLNGLQQEESDQRKEQLILAYHPPKPPGYAQGYGRNGFVSYNSTSIRNEGGYYQPGFAGGTSRTALGSYGGYGGTPFIDPRVVLDALHSGERASENATRLLLNANALTATQAHAIVETNRQATLLDMFSRAVQQPASGTVTTTTQSNAQYGPQQQGGPPGWQPPQQQQQPPYQTQPPDNSGASNGTGANNMQSALHDVGMSARLDNCASCHNPQKRSGGLDITDLNAVAQFAGNIHERIHLAANDPKHMPKPTPKNPSGQLNEILVAAIDASLPVSQPAPTPGDNNTPPPEPNPTNTAPPNEPLPALPPQSAGQNSPSTSPPPSSPEP